MKFDPARAALVTDVAEVVELAGTGPRVVVA